MLIAIVCLWTFNDTPCKNNGQIRRQFASVLKLDTLPIIQNQIGKRLSSVFWLVMVKATRFSGWPTSFFLTHTQESGINVPLRLLIFGTFSRGYGLISYILRRTQNFAKSSPYFLSYVLPSKVRWRFCKILGLSKNKWNLRTYKT